MGEKLITWDLAQAEPRPACMLTMTPAGFGRRSRTSKATSLWPLWPWSEDQVGGRWAGLILASCGHLCSYPRPCPRLQLG